MSLKCIGIRVSPSQIHYTILEEHDDKSIEYSNEVLIIPKALDIPRKLSFVRTTLFSIICEHSITKAGLRTAEGSSQQINILRLNLEGVIQEMISNSTIVSYFAGTLTSLAHRLGTTNSKMKNCCNGENFYHVEHWNDMNKNHRESYLAALASIHT